GRAVRHRSATWPTPRAPISTTRASLPAGALTSVRGTPSSLLNDPALAHVRHRATRAARTRSFTLVLPTEPVIPTTRPAAGAAPGPPASAGAPARTVRACPPRAVSAPS